MEGNKEWSSTYLDRCERLFADIKFEVGVTSVIESLAEAAEPFPEDLRTDGFLAGILFHTDIDGGSLRARDVFRFRSK